MMVWFGLMVKKQCRRLVRIAARFVFVTFRPGMGGILTDRSKRCRCQGRVLPGCCELQTPTTAATGQGAATVNKWIGGTSWELATIAIATDQIAVVVATDDDAVVVVVVVDDARTAAAVAAAIAIVSQRF